MVRMFVQLWSLWLVQVYRSDRVKVTIGVITLPPEFFQESCPLPGPTTTLCPAPHTAQPSNLPSSAYRFGLSSSARTLRRGPLLTTMASDLLLIQQIPLELLPCSMHCDRPRKMVRERDFLLGALDMGKMDKYKSGVTVVPRVSLEGILLQSWRGRLLEN